MSNKCPDIDPNDKGLNIAYNLTGAMIGLACIMALVFLITGWVPWSQHQMTNMLKPQSMNGVIGYNANNYIRARRAFMYPHEEVASVDPFTQILKGVKYPMAKTFLFRIMLSSNFRSSTK